MTLPLVFRAVAQAEFDGAAAWYDGQKPGLGDDFVAKERVRNNRLAFAIKRNPCDFDRFNLAQRFWAREGSNGASSQVSESRPFQA